MATIDLQVAELYSFEVIKTDDSNTGTINLTWKVPGAAVDPYIVVPPVTVADLEVFDSALCERYGELRDELVARGLTVNDALTLATCP